jgi:N-methylhydantoinase B
MNIFTIGGINPDTDSYYSYIETYGGGQGAMYNQDGMDGVHTNMTNTRNAPVEAIENSYPLLVSKYGLVPGSGGPGKFRGGLGMTREITILGHEAKVTLSTERGKLRPWGILGGKSGGVSQCLLYSPDGQKKKLPSKTTMEVKPDYRIALITAGGGGAGNPLEREAQKVREDVIQGFVSLKEAEEEYGVILNPKTLEIEQEKTGKLRKRKTTP